MIGIFPVVDSSQVFPRRRLKNTIEPQTGKILKKRLRGLIDTTHSKGWIFVMADQLKMDSGIDGEQNGSSRSSPCIATVSENSGVNKRYVDITAMIRSLQRTEGMTDCFRSGISDCGSHDCAWRQYCLGSAGDGFQE